MTAALTILATITLIALAAIVLTRTDRAAERRRARDDGRCGCRRCSH